MDQDKFIEALSAVVREQIGRKNQVHIEGIGVFKPVHKTQYQQQFQDGRVVMVPPEDTIEFVPDSK